MLLALVVGLRYPGLVMLAAGWAVVVAIRHYTA
jgi:uncharacterized membrane protein